MTSIKKIAIAILIGMSLFGAASAISAARKRARALFCVSCHSLSGTESCTMPAPACT